MELIVAIAIVAVLGFLASFPLCTPIRDLVKVRMIQGMSNARQIHIATMSMASDGEANEDPSLGWPGDLKARNRIANLSDFVTHLVCKGYLRPGDLKILSAVGYKAYEGKLTSSSNGTLIIPPFSEENCAFKVYLVKKDDPADTVFLASKNYTYNKLLTDPKAKPFGDRGFIVFRKGGDGAVLKNQQAQSLNLVGSLPGGGTVESAENCLNPCPSTP